MRGILRLPTHKVSWAFWAFSLLAPLGAHATCTPDKISVQGDFGTVSFRIELADTPQLRAQGLMNREQMARFAGMLFVYERPQRLAFWMRNTLIPLDMLFIDPTGRIAHIHENAIPLDETPIEGGTGLTHVLEINGGLAARLGIDVGDVLQHESFNQEGAAWDCATG